MHPLFRVSFRPKLREVQDRACSHELPARDVPGSFKEKFSLLFAFGFLQVKAASMMHKP